jgi:hypothetical protein
MLTAAPRAVLALALSAIAFGAVPEPAAARPSASIGPTASTFDYGTLCNILKVAAGTSAGKRILGRLPARLTGNDVYTLVVGLAATHCAPLVKRAVGAARWIYRELFTPATAPPRDTTPPLLFGPDVAISGGWSVGTDGAVPITAYWLGFDFGTGISAYDFELAGSAERLAPGVGSRTVVMETNEAARALVRVWDRNDNWRRRWTDWFTPRSFTERAGEFSAGWRFGSSTGAVGGAVAFTQTRGALAKFVFDGRAVAWVAPRWPGGGQARVWLDGRSVAVVDLFSSSLDPRRVVFSWYWPAVARHTLTIEVLGTPSRPEIEVDGFMLLR